MSTGGTPSPDLPPSQNQHGTDGLIKKERKKGKKGTCMHAFLDGVGRELYIRGPKLDMERIKSPEVFESYVAGIITTAP